MKSIRAILALVVMFLPTKAYTHPHGLIVSLHDQLGEFGKNTVVRSISGDLKNTQQATQLARQLGLPVSARYGSSLWVGLNYPQHVNIHNIGEILRLNTSIVNASLNRTFGFGPTPTISEIDEHQRQHSIYSIDRDTIAPITGLWWNQNEPGWGVSLTQQFDTIFAVIYTYDSSGLPKWYVASNCEIAVNGCYGGLFETKGGTEITSNWNGRNKVTNSVGGVSFTFSDKDTGWIYFAINGKTYSSEITRQVWSKLSPEATMSGLWWNNEESGWGVSLTQQTDVVFATLFTYDVNGFPSWYVASNCQVIEDECKGELYQVSGGSDLTQMWNGANKLVSRVGDVQFSFANTDLGEMSLVINGINAVKEISRQVFAVEEIVTTCVDEDRSTSCASSLAPVCGKVETARATMYYLTTLETFDNACMACNKTDTLSYTEGGCE